MFIIATYDDVKDWDPATAFSMEVLPMSNIYEPLLWYDAASSPPKMLPGLATEYKKSDDGLIWEFKLRKNIFFHDGTRFTAKSVKFVVERNRTLNGGASYLWSDVKEINILSDYLITFELSKPVPFDKIVSSQYGSWIYSPSIDHISKDSLINGYASGTGPYRLKKWVKNKYILLEKYNEYWRGWSDNNHFESILIQTISEASTRVQMIESGLADYAILLPIQLLSRLEQNPDVTVHFLPSWINHFFLMNTKKYPTDNIWIRRAIASSMDRQTISEFVYKKTALEAEGLFPKNMPLFNKPDSLLPFDLAKANKFVEKSRLAKGDISIDFSYVSTSEEYRLTSYMFLDNLRKIGIDVNLTPGIWSTIWDQAKHLDTAPNLISMAWWPTISSPSDWFFGLYGTQNPPIFNLSYYSNSKVDSLMQKGWELENSFPEASSKIYKELQNILIDDCIVIPGFDINVQSVYRSCIQGLKHNPAYSTIFVYNLSRKE